MEPLHSVQYEMTSELATNIQRSLMYFSTRGGWRRDLPAILAVLCCALALAVPVLANWITPGVGGGILFFLTLFVLAKAYRRHWLSYMASTTAIIALHTSDRRVRIDFHDQRVAMETEFLRGESAWTELEGVAIFPDFWALCFSNGGRVVIPASLMTPALQEFVRAKAEQVLAPIDQA